MEVLHFLLPVLLLSPTSGVPVRYDQRQEGELNVHAHLENFIIVLIPSGSVSLLDFIPFKKLTKQEATNDEKYVSKGTGTKVSAPDFPAGKSPYKVDIDKSDENNEKEVLIAHMPTVVIANTQADSEGETADLTISTSSDEDSTTKITEIQPPATEKIENDISNVNSDKKEHAGQRVQIKDEDKKDDKTEVKEDKKDDQKTGKEEEKKEDNKTIVKEEVKDNINDEKKKEEDEIPVIDVIPEKPSKAPKSISFGMEAAKPRLQDVTEDESSRAVKTFKFPSYRQEIIMDPPVGSEEYDKRLKMLRTGVDGCEPGEVMLDNGECSPIKLKQRRGNYFSEERLLPILQFGISPANSDQSD